MIGIYGPDGEEINIDVGPIHTYPGCDAPSHSDEILGLMVALAQGTSWRGPTKMDCGCIVSLDELGEGE